MDVIVENLLPDLANLLNRTIKGNFLRRQYHHRISVLHPSPSGGGGTGLADLVRASGINQNDIIMCLPFVAQLALRTRRGLTLFDAVTTCHLP